LKAINTNVRLDFRSMQKLRIDGRMRIQCDLVIAIAIVKKAIRRSEIRDNLISLRRL
jgi:hypothetical protein